MSPDDPRHGTYAGAVAHWMQDGDRPCEDCARAEWRYRKQRKMDALRGNPRSVPAIGVLRRIRALHAIGWTGPQIAEAAGVSVHTMRSIGYHESARIRASTARRIVAAYDDLCGTWPEGLYAKRARLMASRRGWVPPIMWLDIDDPAEQPDPGYRELTDHQRRLRDDLDPVVIERILAGDTALMRTATKLEREAVVARWSETGRSLNDLERATGIKPERYSRKDGAA